MSGTGISQGTQYLSFRLSEETFTLDVAKVREILDFTKITQVPQTPDFMRGVINLRGSVVPVVDLRLKFGMPRTERSVNTCIVVVEITLGGEPVVIGLLADSVQEVVELEPSQIEPPPRIGAKLNLDFLRGMGKRDDQFLMILDIDKVFSDDELSVAQNVSQDAQVKASTTA